MSSITEEKEAAEVRGHRKERTGTVVSDCQDKTIIIEVVRRAPHKLYRKVVKSHRKYVAHDEKNEAKLGDKVTIVETRPLSKTKCWRLLEIISRAES